MKTNNIFIRETTADDLQTILEIQEQGFGYDKEARLTAELLSDPTAQPVVSLLAFCGDQPVGHILFTRAYFEGPGERPMMHILAPLAVIPPCQRQGIGGQLIRAGIETLRQKGSQLAFVLGHKEYYPKFGFQPKAQRQGYIPPYPIPAEYEDYWMVQPVGGSRGFEVATGKIRCCDVLGRPEHWRDDESDR